MIGAMATCIQHVRRTGVVTNLPVIELYLNMAPICVSLPALVGYLPGSEID